MVAETHPHDIELFEYVEDELPQARRDEIAAHLATCGVCAEQIQRAVAGREALRETTLLELPEGRREEILRNLPEPYPRERRGFFSKQLLAGIAALLLVAALAAVLVKTGGNSGLESSAGGTAGGAAEATATSGGGGKAEDAQAAGLFAGGSPQQVAEDLQRKGFKASVQQDHVVVHGATKAQVREALADRGPGDVEVVVKNP